MEDLLFRELWSESRRSFLNSEVWEIPRSLESLESGVLEDRSLEFLPESEVFENRLSLESLSVLDRTSLIFILQSGVLTTISL